MPKQVSAFLPIDRLSAWLDRFGNKVEPVFQLDANSSTLDTRDRRRRDHRRQSQLHGLHDRTVALCAEAARPLIYAFSAAPYGNDSAGFDDARGIDADRAPGVV